MPLPTKVTSFATITLESGSAVATQIADGTDITANVANVNFPDPYVAQETNPNDGGMSDFDVDRKIMTPECSFDMPAYYTAIAAATNLTVEVTKDYRHPQTNAVINRRTDRCAGKVRVTQAPHNFADTTIPAYTVTFANPNIRKVQESGVANAAWDIDKTSRTYKRNGVDIFPEATI